MDWDNYDPHEHAISLVERNGSCEAPDGNICRKCFAKQHDSLCKPFTAFVAARKFLETYKIKSIW